MAEMDFKTLIVQGLLVGLFVVAIISFVYQFQVDQGASETILDDTTFNSTFIALKQNLTSTQSVAQNQSENQDLSNPIAVFDFLSEAVVGTIKVLKSVFVDVYNLTFGLIITKLGIDPIVLYTITAILLVTAIFLSWRSLKRG